MATATTEPEAQTGTGNGSTDGVTHYTCCDATVALCGQKTKAEEETTESVDCKFCIYLENDPCSATCTYSQGEAA